MAEGDDGEVSVLDFVNAILRETDLRYQQRYDAQTKALDAAFLAQQTAMQTALQAAEKAVQTALLAAEKAVAKAETAAEKRFDAVNEFRAAYNDIINAQLPRNEADARFNALAEKLEDLKKSITITSTAVSSQAAHSAGISDGWKILVGFVGLLATVGTIISIVIAIKG